MGKMRFHNIAVLLLSASIIACGGSGGSATDTSTTSGTTTYTGTLTYDSFTLAGFTANQLASCSVSGLVNMTIYEDGTISATTYDPTATSVSAACQYIDEIFAAEWSGSATDTTFTVSGSADGPNVTMNATASGTYTDTTVDGSGTASIVGKSASSSISASFTFHLDAVQ